VIPATFDYVAPASLTDTVSCLAAGTDARVLAGGQGLVPDLTVGETSAGILVDLRNVPDLDGITVTGAGDIRVGAMVTLDDLGSSVVLAARESALTDGLVMFGDPQVRNRATVGGALAHAHRGVDLPAVAVAMDAVVTVFGADGERTVTADALFADPAGGLAPADVIVAVEFPRPAPRSGSAYQKMRNPGSSYAICGVAATVTLTSDGAVGSAGVVVSGSDRPAVRLRKVEAALAGQPATEAGFAAAALLISEEAVSFPSDLAAPGNYRSHLAEVLITRALMTASDRAREVSA
jgi:carbon-monoxide dehydrogenase medium subunit